MENFYTPSQPGNLPAASRVLVLAPHPDDEIFGCGGTLALYQRMGAEISVHVLTDGAGYAPEQERAEIFSCRQAETNAALALIGIPPAGFGQFRDRSLAAQAGLGDHVLGLIEQHQPDVVMAPSPWEIHPDHLAAGRALLVAVEQLVNRSGRVPGLMFYEIGAPLRADLLIDVTPVWELKRQAMAAFPSQLAHQDYARHIGALNAYRTYTLAPSVQYAEAFSYVPAEAFPNSGAWPEQRIMARWMAQALAAADVQAELLQTALAGRDADLRSTLVALQRAREDLQMGRDELQQARTDYDAILRSSSWRLTAPLRWFRQLFAAGNGK